MRIVKEPKVYLLAGPSINWRGLYDFCADNDLEWPTDTIGTKAAETLVECAGRICYMSFGGKAVSKTNRSYIQNLLGRQNDGSFREGPAHGSVVEHPSWSFIITGAGRGFSHEQVRHRVGWGYSQLSTRYCDFEREDSKGTWDPGFTIPPLAQLSQETKETLENMLTESRHAYTILLAKIERDLQNNKEFMEDLSGYSERDRKRMLRKAARGAARDILPIATEAIMVMTANARAIWNCIYLRGSEHAEAQIRSVYVQLAQIMEKEFPSLFYGLEYKKLWDGSLSVVMPRSNI